MLNIVKKRIRERAECMEGDGDGFVLAWFAILLIVLMGMAGFAVDVWNWWYTAAHNQRAADAAALAGVIHLPGNLSEAEDAAEAQLIANGYQVSDATIAQGAQSNQLEVTVETTVENHFAGLLGIETTDVARSATAEFQGPVPMGSPVNQLGNDPEGDQTSPTEAPRFWLNTAGPNATTQSGDRHTAANCSRAADNCQAGVNVDYDTNGYFFAIDVRATNGNPLTIQAYDPGFFYVGDRCENNLYPSGDPRLLTLAAHDPVLMGDAAFRYVEGNSRFCAGDQDIRGRSVVTTFSVREPDATPYDNTDNPVIPGCTTTFEARNGDVNTLDMWLRDETDLSPEGMKFREFFRQWTDLCTVNVPVVGQYLVQVQTTVNGGDSGDGGHNRYSLRAGLGIPGTPTFGSNVGFFANGRLPIYVNQNDGSVSTNFFLARLEPLNANRILELNFFDIGDVSSGSVAITIEPPDEATVGSPPMALDTFPECTFDPRRRPLENLSPCTRSGMDSDFSDGFQGGIVQVLIPIPDTYDCDETDVVNGCWVKMRLDFTDGAQPQDTTTWSANILGDPVRLVD